MKTLFGIVFTVCALLLAIPVEAAAQCPNPTPTTGTLVTQPTKVEFTASPDHNTVLLGTTVLTSYSVAVCDGTTLVKSTDVGKPVPNASNIVTVGLTVTGLPTNKALYVTIGANGPGGTGWSVPSNPFAYLGVPATPGAPVAKP